MLSDLKRSHHRTEQWWAHEFGGPDGELRYSFAVDASGQLLPDTTPEARRNYDACVAGATGESELGVTDLGIRPFTRTWWVPGEGTCECGEVVVLSDGLENYCDGCGRCYNMSGDPVMGRAAWEAAGGPALAGEVWDEED